MVCHLKIIAIKRVQQRQMAQYHLAKPLQQIQALLGQWTKKEQEELQELQELEVGESSHVSSQT
jgi:hypothetical protein